MRRLLQVEHDDANKRRLLHWCLAAAFLHGILECESLDRVREVRFDPWGAPSEQAVAEQEDWIKAYLRRHDFPVSSSRRGKEGDVFVKFGTPEISRAALQACSLIGKDTQVPFRRCCKWGPKDELVNSREWCKADCKVAQDSLAALPSESEVTIVAAEFLPIQSKTNKSMFYLCTKCSVLPNGILPLVVLATYHAAELNKDEGIEPLRDGSAFLVRARFFGVIDEMRFTKPDSGEVVDLVKAIREGMDKEFQCTTGALPPDRCRSIVAQRQDQVLNLMRRLEAGDPMFSTQRSAFGFPSRSGTAGHLFAPRLRDLLAGLDLGDFDCDDLDQVL
mmetsp:Transcript_168001/g.534385  ORF Transcript_168001/g.534385 Transcript_168001/m.534385 type:complete len:333 (+) Transcript_168001:1584-2582(+)